MKVYSSTYTVTSVPHPVGLSLPTFFGQPSGKHRYATSYARTSRVFSTRYRRFLKDFESKWLRDVYKSDYFLFWTSIATCVGVLTWSSGDRGHILIIPGCMLHPLPVRDATRTNQSNGRSIEVQYTKNV